MLQGGGGVLSAASGRSSAMGLPESSLTVFTDEVQRMSEEAPHVPLPQQQTLLDSPAPAPAPGLPSLPREASTLQGGSPASVPSFAHPPAATWQLPPAIRTRPQDAAVVAASSSGGAPPSPPSQLPTAPSVREAKPFALLPPARVGKVSRTFLPSPEGEGGEPHGCLAPVPPRSHRPCALHLGLPASDRTHFVLCRPQLRKQCAYPAGDEAAHRRAAASEISQFEAKMTAEMLQAEVRPRLAQPPPPLPPPRRLCCSQAGRRPSAASLVSRC